MNLKSCTIQRFLQQFFFNVVTRGNNNSTRHIKQLASLCLQCLHLDQKKLVQVYRLSIVTTTAEGQCFTISNVSGLRLFFPHFLLFQCAIFCVFVYLWVLLQANSERKTASKNVSFAFFYSFGQTIIGSKHFHHHIPNCNFSFSFSVTFGVKPITNSPRCFEDKTAVITLEEHEIHIISLTMYNVTSPLLLILNLYFPSTT